MYVRPYQKSIATCTALALLLSMSFTASAGPKLDKVFGGIKDTFDRIGNKSGGDSSSGNSAAPAIAGIIGTIFAGLIAAEIGKPVEGKAKVEKSREELEKEDVAPAKPARKRGNRQTQEVAAPVEPRKPTLEIEKGGLENAPVQRGTEALFQVKYMAKGSDAPLAGTYELINSAGAVISKKSELTQPNKEPLEAGAVTYYGKVKIPKSMIPGKYTMRVMLEYGALEQSLQFPVEVVA